MKIKKIEQIDYNGYVYNFSVTDNHNYIVNDVVVANCHYCYTSATKEGSNFSGIVEKAKYVWGNLKDYERPFQIAIGGAGESTIHPDWVNFVKTVKELGIIPNYTTNGMHLSDDIIKGTIDYCGGVAISYHPHIKDVYNKAIKKLSILKDNNVKLNTHIILGDDKSFFDMQAIYETYKDEIDYFVILPYQVAGRAEYLNTDEVWLKTFNWISTLSEDRQAQFAFGALFYEWMKDKQLPLKMSVYEPEIFSGYRILDNSYKLLRKSSYNLEAKEILIK